QKAQREGAGSKDERERSSRACLVVDCGLRQATRDGITMAEPCQKVRRANSKEFLSRVDAISMLGRERACRRHTFDVRKQQTSGSERNDALDVAQAEPGRLKRGQARWHLSRGGYSQVGEPERRGHSDR